MTEKGHKLYKVASDLNVSKDDIVNYLNTKGFNLPNKPTTVLDDAMLNLLNEKFKKEKKQKEVIREKINKTKELKQEVKKTIEVSTPKHIVNEEEKTKKDLQPILKEPKIEEVAPKIVKPNILGKIDLDALKKPASTKAEPKKTEIEQEVKDKQKINRYQVLEKIEEPKVQPKEEIKIEPKVEPIVDDKKIEEKVINENIIEQNKKIEEIKVDTVTEIVKVIDETETSKVEAQAAPETYFEVKTQEIEPKEEAIEEIKEDFVELTKLKGLSIVGKIDLKSEAEKVREQEQKEKLAREKESRSKDNKFRDKNRDFDRNKDKFQPKTKEQYQKDKYQKDKFQKEAPAPTKSFENKIESKDKEKEIAKPKKFKTRKHTGNQAILPIPETTKSTEERNVFKPKPNYEVIDKEEKKKKKKKKVLKELISEQEINRAIRETKAGMDVSHSASRAKFKMKKRAEREEKEIKLREEREREEKILKLTEFVTTSDLANLIGVPANEIILKCMGLGMMVTINQRLDKDTITLIASDYGLDVEFLDEKESQIEEYDIDPDESLLPRPPIVTIMGHVDHGKTSLLDTIRNTNVVAGEAGGITQHIGAYKVVLPNNKTITFLDTPGHEAFTAMRARGAQVTDIVVLVVAADDSVMPQTIEAISHAKAANVPIIVAINKIDKSDANPDRIRQQLADQNVLVEEWGGKYQSVEISAKQGINIDVLLDKILLEAELLELKANPNRKARGIVIESNMKQGFGPVATIIVQKGTLNVGDPFVAGISYGKVRALLDERERRIKSAGPGDPVLVVGFDELPEAGDVFVVTDSDVEAKEKAIQRKQLKREQDLRQSRFISLDEISAQIQRGGVKELNLVVKADVAGSVEALSDSLLKLSTDEVKVNILLKGAGNITESDVMLASASNAVVIGFNVIPTAKAKKIAENEKVDIRIYNIIYDCINEIQLALEGLLSPDLKEEVVATVEIRKVFRTSKFGNIAGCYVLSGTISRNDKVRVLRDGFELFKGTIASLKRNKDDVKEVQQGFECGIQINNFNDIEEGDIIEAYKVYEVRRKLH